MPKRPLLPKRLISRNTFLSPELWDALKVIARFHSDVLRRLGSHEGIPRNDMIAHFLGEDALEYWRQIGGFPVDEADWVKKVERAAKNLAEDVRQREAERSRGDLTIDEQIEAIAKFPKE